MTAEINMIYVKVLILFHNKIHKLGFSTHGVSSGLNCLICRMQRMLSKNLSVKNTFSTRLLFDIGKVRIPFFVSLNIYIHSPYTNAV